MAIFILAKVPNELDENGSLCRHVIDKSPWKWLILLIHNEDVWFDLQYCVTWLFNFIFV
jgi:hypothetical protein